MQIEKNWALPKEPAIGLVITYEMKTKN